MNNTSNNTSQRPASRESAILAPLAFFDIFNYPLTELEIWKWMYCGNFQFSISNFQSIFNSQFSISDIQKMLENSENLKKIVGQKDGFYFLNGRESLVARRRDLYRDAEQRWKKLRRIANILQYVPFVEMVAGCNTLAINDFKPGSDIDAFIITRHGRIWQARFWVTMLVNLLGEWRHKSRIAEKICLSFYLADNALNLGPIAKKPYDIYLAYWVALIAPLYSACHSDPAHNSDYVGGRISHECVESRIRGRSFAKACPELVEWAQDDIYKKFLEANQWVKKYLPNFISYEPVKFERKVGESKILATIKNILEKVLSGKIGDRLEGFFRRFQRKKMERNYRSAYHRHNSDVVISDQMLKFHEIDKRDEFRRKFELRLAEISKRP